MSSINAAGIVVIGLLTIANSYAAITLYRVRKHREQELLLDILKQ